VSGMDMNDYVGATGRDVDITASFLYGYPIWFLLSARQSGVGGQSREEVAANMATL